MRYASDPIKKGSGVLPAFSLALLTPVMGVIISADTGHSEREMKALFCYFSV